MPENEKKMRLIDANDLYNKFIDGESDTEHEKSANQLSRYLIRHAITIDPETLPVVRRLREELKKAERARDAICSYIDSEGLLRKYFCENGNADFEPFVCPSLKKHSGYIDSDDCEECEHFCNSFLEKKEE